MTETRHVSIDEVRTLVSERQRYDDWLTALDARRDETPERVFERVRGDYVTRRRDVMNRLREHVGALASMGSDLDARLASLEARLGTLEDERAEAMLRTAVGEFDGDRWEQVRQSVEAQIAELGDQRTLLQVEGDEVRTLLASARSEPEVAPSAVPDAAVAPDAPVEDVAPEATDADLIVADTMGAPVDASVSEVIAPVPLLAQDINERRADGLESSPLPTAAETAEELAELDNALALFSNDAPNTAFHSAPAPVISTPLMDGLDVFDDSELGDLRMAPPSHATATVTPPAASQPVGEATSGSTARDGFDDLAFLRSVVDPSAQGGMARASGSGDQLKTLRCTECSTMNLPTEWYCERCGGELAAF
ncbi:MAG: hypothetical protein IPP90_16465 [Gemmatimonadaceae bacterium]|nr:hypothetical protein [Gemmatimonadaceae bacterium]